jgi:hypothetical protein
MVEQGYEDAPEERTDERASAESVKESSKENKVSNKASVNQMNPDLEQHLLNLGKDHKTLARLSVTDVADRYLRDKTDAIADIIRSISEQCAAAVEGLHLAQDAEDEESAEASSKLHQNGSPRLGSEYEDGRTTRATSEVSDLDNNSLHPDNRHSSIPPTPDLVHNRSSTSMSMVSSSTFPERSSQQYGPGEIPTRIVEDDDEHAHETESMDDQQTETGTLSKQASEDLMRPQTARVIS